MTNRTEEIKQLKDAIKSLETQRAILGDAVVDLSLKALQLQLQIAELVSTQAPATFLESEGERCHATILFSDLSGYTAMNEKLDPEVVQEMMNRIKARAIQVVERQEGIVNQFVGDEILALFGIPNAHENDPCRAVSAALELHEIVNEMSKEVEPLIGRPLTLHSGINTGLIVTSVWDDREGKYGVTGDAINTGARLLAQAKANEILVSPDTQHLIAPYFRTESLEPVKMKGKVEPMIPYRILGKTNIKTRIEAAEKRGFTAYIGREEELDTLHRCLKKTEQGKGQFVTICGEAGLGKSRLIHEFCKQLDRDKINIVQGRCQSYGVSTPYLPFLDALRRELSLKEEDSPSELHEKVVANLINIDSKLEKYIPVILHLLSIPSNQYPLPEELVGEKLKQIIQESLITINTLSTQHSTTLLILEDWHWADEASDDTLLKQLDSLASFPLMIVVLYRHMYTSNWGHIDFHTPICLMNVSEKNVESMIKDIYGVSLLPKKLTSQIFERSEGNPFFIEELCDLLKEERMILINEEKVSLPRPIEKIKFPETIQAVILTKMDRLESEPREVIRLASVIGREFLERILAQITTRKERLSPSLEYLKSSDIIHPMKDIPEMTYQFNHVITQEVTYQSLLIKQRTFLHQLVAETIEVLYEERLEEQYEVLAYHYSKSDKWDKAIHYLELAGDKAARNFSLLDARTYYKDAINLIDAHSKTEELKRKRMHISLHWAQISHYAGLEDYIQVLEISLDYAKELKDEQKNAHLNYWLGQRNYMMGNLKKATEHFTDCIDIAENLDKKKLLAQAYAAIGRVYFFEAEYLLANHCLEKCLPIFEELDVKNEVSYAASFLCVSYGLTGDFEKALAYGNQATNIAEETGDLSRKAISYMWLGACYSFQGNWEKCIEISHHATKIANPLGDLIAIILGRGYGAYAHFFKGNPEKGISKLEECVAHMEEIKFYISYPLFYGLLAYCYARAGKTEEAIDPANKCLEWSPKAVRGWECLAHYALAMAESKKSNPDTQLVDQTMETGLQLCKDRGQRPYLAQGYFEYANIYLGRKDKKKAKTYLNKAIDLFTEMKMTGWLEYTNEFRNSL